MLSVLQAANLKWLFYQQLQQIVDRLSIELNIDKSKNMPRIKRKKKSELKGVHLQLNIQL